MSTILDNSDTKRFVCISMGSSVKVSPTKPDGHMKCVQNVTSASFPATPLLISWDIGVNSDPAPTPFSHTPVSPLFVYNWNFISHQKCELLLNVLLCVSTFLLLCSAWPHITKITSAINSIKCHFLFLYLSRNITVITCNITFEKITMFYYSYVFIM